MVNEPWIVYVRMYVDEGEVWSLAIMKANDVLQTKYIMYPYNDITINSSIGASLYIVIENVTKHMSTSYADADMNNDPTTITIDGGSDSAYGTWTSTIEPDNSKVELNCKIVENDGTIVTAKCISESTWSESVFNRIPIWIDRMGAYACFGINSITNHMLFGEGYFSVYGSIPGGWNEYNVTGSGTSLKIDNQFTIMNLPESFVSYWVNMCAKAYMGNDRVLLVPPGSS